LYGSGEKIGRKDIEGKNKEETVKWSEEKEKIRRGEGNKWESAKEREACWFLSPFNNAL
jgi:hypothetical protein